MAKKATAKKKTAVKKAAPKKTSKKKTVPKKAAKKKTAVKKTVPKKKAKKKTAPKKIGVKKTTKLKNTIKERKKGTMRKTASKKTSRVSKKVPTSKTSSKINSRTSAKKLSKKDLGQYKNFLLSLKDKLYQNIHDLEDDNLKKSQKDITGDLSGYSLHLADMGTENFDRELALNLASTESELLHKVDNALERIENHNFGICDCGKQIQEKRLKAVPYARLCIECQEQEELEEKMRE